MEDQQDQFTFLMNTMQQLVASQQNLTNAMEAGGNAPNNPKIRLEVAALQWYLNKVVAAGENVTPFADWDTFVNEIRQAFQPPNYQHHL
nr:11332_t:CDS:2 [Entrophospora candida]